MINFINVSQKLIFDTKYFFNFIDSKDELTWIDDWLKIMNIIFNQIFNEGEFELILKLNDPVTFSLTFTLLFRIQIQ